MLGTCQKFSYLSESLSSFWLEQPSLFSSLVSSFSRIKRVKGQRKPQPTPIDRGILVPFWERRILHSCRVRLNRLFTSSFSYHQSFYQLPFSQIFTFSHFLHSFNHLFIVPACMCSLCILLSVGYPFNTRTCWRFVFM